MSVSAQSDAIAPRDRVPAFAGEEAAGRSLDEAREHVIAYFSRCADTIGLPRSLAAIYATLFLAETPLPFEEIASRSSLSKASASTGLRDLERLHGVERVVVPQDRRSFYRAQLSLRRILGAFLAETVKPGLDDGSRLLRDAADLLGKASLLSPADDHFRTRLESLQTWHERAAEILPMLALLGAAGTDD